MVVGLLETKLYSSIKGIDVKECEIKCHFYTLTHRLLKYHQLTLQI